jgi:hypothetical protein
MSIHELFTIVLPVVILILVTFIFLRISRRMRKRGGSFTSLLLGSTYELHGRDRREAIEVIVEQKAGKKQEEPESGDSHNKEPLQSPSSEKEKQPG